jgi:hypothetical protein
MADRYVEEAKANMGALERLFKGLPVISGYVDKELRRDADKRVRELVATELDVQKRRLFDVQKKLLKGGGLKYLDDLDEAIQKLQVLVDRIRTASYGYAGLFDAVKVQEEQLDALHRFDVAMAERTVAVENAANALEAAVDGGDDPAAAIARLTDIVADMNQLYGRRTEAIEDPDLLMDTDYVPEVDDEILDAAG